MAALQIGDKVPDFELNTTDKQLTRLSQLTGKKVVLYFYPKDNTPGCTQEAKDFADLYEKFTELNTVVLGVSRDNISCHQKFKDKFTLPFPLVSDSQEKLCRFFEVIIQKNLFKKLVFGIERSTFLINEEGKVQKIWRKIKVKDHATEVLTAINNEL